MLVDDSLYEFDGDGRVEEFDAGEDDNMFCEILTVFSFVTATNFNAAGVK